MKYLQMDNRKINFDKVIQNKVEINCGISAIY